MNDGKLSVSVILTVAVIKLAICFLLYTAIYSKFGLPELNVLEFCCVFILTRLLLAPPIGPSNTINVSVDKKDSEDSEGEIIQ
jgi:hypothetical protein